MPDLILGTSGFVYPHWKGLFYPEDLPERERLSFYAERFGAVELNVTFYNLPERESFERWRREVPKDFRFVVKGSRYITHMKKLTDVEKPVAELLTRASALGTSFSAVLWQMPANFHANTERLGRFCDTLAGMNRKVRHAFEFRHESWFKEEVYAILGRHNHALCIAHSDRWPRREVVTADFTYLRFHGGESTYDSAYSPEELESWAGKARGWLSSGMDVYAFFNNDVHGHAVTDARLFGSLAATHTTTAPA